jgi:hypothetical protein
MVSSCAGAARSHAAGLPDHTARRLRCPWLRCRLAVNRDIPHHGRLGRAERLLTTDCQDGHGQPGPLEDPVVLNILRQGGEPREPGVPLEPRETARSSGPTLRHRLSRPPNSTPWAAGVRRSPAGPAGARSRSLRPHVEAGAIGRARVSVDRRRLPTGRVPARASPWRLGRTARARTRGLALTARPELRVVERGLTGRLN